MVEQTNIEWTDHTFNSWEGCQKVAPECDYCYAEARDRRFTGGIHWGPKAPRRRTSEKNWNNPRRWNANATSFYAEHGRRQRVFCASLADVFDNAVVQEWREDLWNLIRDCDQLDWQLLTKRPQNIAKMLPPDWGDGWSHVWLGTSAGTQKTADQNIPHLLGVPAAIRFVSAEPLLEEVDLSSYLGTLDWVICGGESGPNARPMHPDWAQALRDQCSDASVPFFFKQWGEFEAEQIGPEQSRSTQYPPGHVNFRKVGKKAAGRKLGGQEWNEVPQ